MAVRSPVGGHAISRKLSARSGSQRANGSTTSITLGHRRTCRSSGRRVGLCRHSTLCTVVNDRAVRIGLGKEVTISGIDAVRAHLAVNHAMRFTQFVGCVNAKIHSSGADAGDMGGASMANRLRRVVHVPILSSRLACLRWQTGWFGRTRSSCAGRWRQSA